VKIGIVAPSVRMEPEVAEAVRKFAGEKFPGVELSFHDQCFLKDGHFAGPDEARRKALVAMANDESVEAIWFARGGYGACRIAEAAIAELTPAALQKPYLGYSDAGFLLAGLYRAGARRVAHGPMPIDIVRDGGDAALVRALAFLTQGDTSTLEPNADTGSAAFNLTVLSHLLGTPLEPDLSGHVLMVEDVSEQHYRIDRAFFHLFGNPKMRRIAGLRLGRFSDIPENDPPFLKTEEEIARYWCARSGVAYLGRADIGHDAANKIVPFGA
jgi:muramoyltetrapeptide carboxypeptidase